MNYTQYIKDHPHEHKEVADVNCQGGTTTLPKLNEVLKTYQNTPTPFVGTDKSENQYSKLVPHSLPKLPTIDHAFNPISAQINTTKLPQSNL